MIVAIYLTDTQWHVAVYISCLIMLFFVLNRVKADSNKLFTSPLHWIIYNDELQ